MPSQLDRKEKMNTFLNGFNLNERIKHSRIQTTKTAIPVVLSISVNVKADPRLT
jgi:hypothetical protein